MLSESALLAPADAPSRVLEKLASAEATRSTTSAPILRHSRQTGGAVTIGANRARDGQASVFAALLPDEVVQANSHALPDQVATPAAPSLKTITARVPDHAARPTCCAVENFVSEVRPMLHIIGWTTISIAVLVAGLLIGRAMLTRQAVRERARRERQTRRVSALMNVDFVPNAAPSEGELLDAAIPNEMGASAADTSNPVGPTLVEDDFITADPVLDAPSMDAPSVKPPAAAPSGEVMPAPPIVSIAKSPQPAARLSLLGANADAKGERRVRYAFNMAALPGIAYIGKHLEPKLAFQRMEGGGTVLRVVTSASTIELPLPPNRLLAGLRMASRDASETSQISPEPSPRPVVAGSPGLSAGTSAFVHAEHTRVVERLSDHLQREPEDEAIRRRLGQALLAKAGITLDEMERAHLLELSIEHLQHASPAQGEDEALCTLLGKACYERARIGPEADPEWLAEADVVLRRALALGASASSEAAWLLQQSLQLNPGSATPGQIEARLQEAQTLQVQGLAHDAAHPARWQAAVMRTGLLVADLVQRNATARRLYLRQLYARYQGAMDAEEAPELLEAWIAMLCAAAESGSGASALERYIEAEGVLRRMPSSPDAGVAQARALADLALSRVRVEQAAAPVALLVWAEEALKPYVDQDHALRLRAAHIAMARTRYLDEATAADLYRQVAELAVPLTSVPSLAVDALRLVLGALLALGDTRDQGVYARCLAVLAGPSDASSLWLLAESAFLEGHHAAGCCYAEQAWRVSGLAAPRMLDQWQRAHARWLATEGDSPEATASLRHLRMARAKRGAAA